MAVANCSMRRKVMSVACKLTNPQLNDMINRLLDERKELKRLGLVSADADQELQYLGELWCRRVGAK